MKHIITFFLLFIATASTAQIGDTIAIDYEKGGSISFASFVPSTQRLSANSVAFLKLFIANNNLDVDFILKKTKTDAYSSLHQRFQQTYKGFKVYGGNYNVHSKLGLIEAVNGKFYPLNIPSCIAVVNESAALANALNSINAVSYSWQDPQMEAFYKSRMNNPSATLYPQGELVIINKEVTKTEDKLCWAFNISVKEPYDDIEVFIDATNGSLVEKKSRLCFAVPNANTKYYGMQHIDFNFDVSLGANVLQEFRGVNNVHINTQNIHNSTNFKLATDFMNVKDTWDNANWVDFANHQQALDAHWSMEQVVDYFESQHSRNSYDNAGATILSYVHFSNSNDNANWDPTFKAVCMGDGGTHFNPLTAVDICGHEIGHAIYEAETNSATSTSLENAAIREGLSDILGISVKDWAIPGSLNKWEFGNKVMKNALYLRSLSDPKSGYGKPSPDCYGSKAWFNEINNKPNGHYLNGVFNKWFYLLAEGGVGTNDLGKKYNVNGIGIVAASKIVMYYIDNYLNATDVYKDARNGTIYAAQQIAGTTGSTMETSVINAWYAVGVDYSLLTSGTTCFTTPYITITTNPTTSNFSGNVYIPNDISINGNVTFSDANVILEYGTTITVPENSTLSISGSRFSTCSGRWIGIVVQSGGNLIFDGTNTTSTLIENANTAITYDDDINTSNIPSSISINNVIFNKCPVGIKINHPYNTLTTANLSIANCLFTSRQIYKPNNSWDNVATIKNSGLATPLPYPNTPNSYNSPYISNSTYPVIGLVNYLGGNINQYPSIGIMTNGTTINGGINSNLLIIGGAGTITEPNSNLFDNIDIGIQAQNTSLKIYNCTFQNPAQDGEDKKGIKIKNGNNNTVAIVKMPSSATTPVNAFFDMNTAIEVSGSKNVAVSNCDVRSSQKKAAITNLGYLGIGIFNSHYTQINIDNNKIYNIQNPIWFSGGFDRGGAVYFGDLFVNNNFISNQLSTLNNANAFVTNGITLDAIIHGDADNTRTYCIDNKLIDVINGIMIRGWKGVVDVEINRVNLVNNTTSVSVGEQYGINVEGSYGIETTTANSKIQSNIINGHSSNAHSTAIRLAQLCNYTIDCNTVAKCENGFKFTGANPFTKFTDNHINSDNKNGVYLRSAIIGRQGNDGIADAELRCTSNNDWGQGAAWWQSQNPTQNMIYNDLTDPTDAEFVVRDIDNFNPALGGSSFLINNNYNIGTGLILVDVNDPDGFKCFRCFGHPKRSLNIVEILEEIAAGTTLLPNDEAQARLEVMQQQLYELATNNPELAQNSTDIQQFMYDNQWQSLDFIHYLGYFAANGNMEMVNNILTYWLPANNRLDDNYRTYYEWLVAMHTDNSFTPNPTEVLALANKCPLKDGNIIYAIRNLYNAITGSINQFEDNCDANTQSRGASQETKMIRLKQPRAKQSIVKDGNIVLYPNPTRNIINIISPNIKAIEVVDIMGKVVLQKSINNMGQTSLSVSELQKGVYIVKAINAEGKTLISKLIKE